MTAYPQVLMNLRVKEKVDLSTVPEVAAVMQSVESRLEGSGRLLVRYSGTEPLLRVMLEGQDQVEIRSGARRSLMPSSSMSELLDGVGLWLKA
jgi:phosphoglucosamine mutase